MENLLRRPLYAAELAHDLKLSFRGENAQITSIATIEEAVSGALIFTKATPASFTSRAICIGPASLELSLDSTLLISTSPRVDFIRALLLLEARGLLAESKTPPRIHPTAKIGAGVVIGPGCEVGANVVIEPNAVIMNRTRIGANSLIRANATIGSAGFGYERDENGKALRFVHLGGVQIGCDVEIGANTCIARGTLGDTVIEDGAKIDNLVHIAHNVRVCRDAFVIAGAEISGGCRIGIAAWIGPNVCIREKIDIGDSAFIGIGATVIANVPPGEVHAGNPARRLSKPG